MSTIVRIICQRENLVDNTMSTIKGIVDALLTNVVDAYKCFLQRDTVKCQQCQQYLYIDILIRGFRGFIHCLIRLIVHTLRAYARGILLTVFF